MKNVMIPFEFKAETRSHHWQTQEGRVNATDQKNTESQKMFKKRSGGVA